MPRLPTKGPIVAAQWGYGTRTLGTGWSPPTHWLNVVSPSLPKMEISGWHLAFMSSLTIRLSCTHAHEEKEMDKLKAVFTSKPPRGCTHHWEKNWFSKIMTGPDCPFNCMLSSVMVCPIFLVHYKNKRRNRKKEYGNQESLRFPFKFSVSALAVLALSLYCLLKMISLSMLEVILLNHFRQFSVITLILSKLLAIAIKLLHGSILPS